jgi:hypothetical protein
MKIIFILFVLCTCNIINPKKKSIDAKAIATLLLLRGNSSTTSNATTSLTDSTLYQESIATNSLTIFPNTPAMIFNSQISDKAHGDFILMKVNLIAKNSIDAAAKKPINNSFTEGSLIVKERYSSGNLVQIISMKKVSGFNSGWAWGEYSPTGSTQYSVNANGSGCISCHTKGKDYVRIFEY